MKVPVGSIPPQPAAPESLAYYVDELPYRIAPGDLLNVDFGVQLVHHFDRRRTKVRPLDRARPVAPWFFVGRLHLGGSGTPAAPTK